MKRMLEERKKKDEVEIREQQRRVAKSIIIKKNFVTAYVTQTLPNTFPYLKQDILNLSSKLFKK